MAPLKSLLLVSALTSSAAFAPQSSVASSKTALKESFGFDFAEDSYENTPAEMLGEANLKQWIGTKVDRAFVNRQVSLFDRMTKFG